MDRRTFLGSMLGALGATIVLPHVAKATPVDPYPGFPQRVAVEDDCSGCIQEVRLNGVKITHAVAIDRCEGWADVLAQDVNGDFLEAPNGHGGVIRRVYGDVQITLADDWRLWID